MWDSRRVGKEELCRVVGRVEVCRVVGKGGGVQKGEEGWRVLEV